jgi:hypothetical protein
MVLRKKEVYTHVTPIPSHIPRQLALDILHSHGEIINLNPLVLEHHAIKAPRDAKSDEYYSTWYEITERIQYLPGIGKMGSGKINFKGCFHDMPWGLQTHIYAPMNIDLRNNWRIAGNQPGEPPERHELGIGAPADGLYLREDIEIRCNITLVSFVKSQLKAASKVLVDRLIKKAELLDAGVLLAMMENGRLKTINPADRSKTIMAEPQIHGMQQPLSPGLPYRMMSVNYAQGRPLAETANQYQYYGYPPPPPSPHYRQGVELPGDNYYHDPHASQDSSYLSSQYSPRPTHASYQSDFSASSPEQMQGRWSDYNQSQMSSRPESYSSDPGGARISGIDHKALPRPPSELPAMAEVHEERDGRPPPPPFKDSEKANYMY